MDLTQGDPLAAAAAILAAVIALTGVLVTGSIRGATRLKVAEQRLAAYQRLWETLEPAQFHGESDDFDEEKRRNLAKEMTKWYYASGIYLTDSCRNIFINARDNLDAAEVEPTSLGDLLEQDERWTSLASDDARRAKLSRQQLSLLRTSMKADLGQYGRWYRRGKLEETERAFLKGCGEVLWRRPWRRTWRAIARDAWKRVKNDTISSNRQELA